MGKRKRLHRVFYHQTLKSGQKVGSCHLTEMVETHFCAFAKASSMLAVCFGTRNGRQILPNVYEQCMHVWVQQSEDWDHQGWLVTNRWRFFCLFSFSLFAVNCSIKSSHPRNKTRICSISMSKLGHVTHINLSRVRIMRALTGGVAFASSDFTCGHQIWATAKFCCGITTADLSPLKNTPQTSEALQERACRMRRKVPAQQYNNRRKYTHTLYIPCCKNLAFLLRVFFLLFQGDVILGHSLLRDVCVIP